MLIKDLHKRTVDGGEWVNISLQRLLTKMEDEIRRAKSAGTEAEQRERIHSIKTLCELVLDESPQQGIAAKTGYSTPVQQPVQFVPVQAGFPQQKVPASQPAPAVPQPKKLQMEDEANGDSLFDF